MDIFAAIAFFVFGTIVGSFLNVVIYRYNTEMGVGGRSRCFSCGKKLRWFELIPVFSFIFLGGKCGSCKSKISWQYPLVECATGLVFVLVFLKESGLFPPDAFPQSALPNAFFAAYLLIIFSILIAITGYDIKHKIIPDGLVYAFIILSFLKLFADFSGGFAFAAPAVLDLFAGPIIAAPFALAWLLSRGKWMGFGDAKLALGIGWFLGLVSGASAIILGFWAGGIFGIAGLVYSKYVGCGNLSLKSEVPFAPFLIFGLLGAYLFGFDFLSLGAFLR